MSRGARIAWLLGLVYLAALVVITLALRFVGERLWVTTVALYLPRLGFLLPMPFVCGLLAVTKQPRRAAIIGAISSVFVIFVLMGLKLGGRRDSAPKSIRIMTWNTFQGRINNEQIPASMAREKADIFFSQASGHRTKELFRQGSYATLEIDDEFMLATRFPLVEKYVAPELEGDSMHRGNFVRYTLDTPLGLVDLFNVHPRSIRSGVERARGKGLSTKLGDPDQMVESVSSIDENTDLRQRQIAAALVAIRASKHPVIVAGDTNLPSLSPLYHDTFEALGLHDAFDEVGSGFGYTFPAKHPWMRIDRVLGDSHFRFLRMHAGELLASDHHYVVADFTTAP